MKKKINFFKKVWYSITKFDQYPKMALEGTKRAIKYLILLVGLVTFFLVINSTINLYKTVGSLSIYIQNNIPEFSYANGEITMDTEEPIVIKDVKYNGIETIDRIVIAPNSLTAEEKLKVKDENKIEGVTVFLFKNQVILRTQAVDEQVAEMPYLYDDIIKNYTQGEKSEFNKAEFIEYIKSEQMGAFYLSYALVIAITLLLTNILVAFVDTLQIAILGWITSSILKIKMKFSAIFSMAIYSLTLSMILNIIYIIFNYFTNFTISYFEIAYIAIAYIYIATAIFTIKDDFVKRQQIVSEIEKEQEKVREEIIERDEKEKKDEEDDKKEKEDDNKQPKGSEA